MFSAFLMTCIIFVYFNHPILFLFKSCKIYWAIILPLILSVSLSVYRVEHSP